MRFFVPGETRQCVEEVPQNGRGEVEAQAGLPLHLRPAQVHQTGPHREFKCLTVADINTTADERNCNDRFEINKRAMSVVI